MITIVPSLANFAVISGEVSESEASGMVVRIQLSAPARSEGSITVTLDQGQALYGANFTTSPAAIDNLLTFNVAQNETGASFKILPIDNSTCSNLYLSASFTISSVSGAVKAGPNAKYYITIKDNDAAIATFAESAGTVGENNTSGIVVKINFSKPADGSGSIYLSTSDNKYGTKYTTTPAMIQDCDYFEDCSYYFTLEVPKDATSVEFTIFPINNAIDNSDYKTEFYMYGGSGNGCWQIAPGAKYILTIVDDD